MNAIRKLFKRENILVLSLLFVALLSIVGVPQSLGITSEQILLLLIGVLALDTLIERLGYLDRIETQITELNNKLEPQIKIDMIFRPREELGSFEDCLVDGENIWVASGTLKSFLHHYANQIQKAAKSGKRFRFLIINPDNHTVLSSIAKGTLLEDNLTFLKSEAQESLSILKMIESKAPKGNVEIRLADFAPLNMYRIVDSEKDRGEMVIEHFGYKISTSERRHFIVKKKIDPETYSFYLVQFENMWNDGVCV